MTVLLSGAGAFAGLWVGFKMAAWLITGTPFVASILASFAMDGLPISKAQATLANGSGFVGVSDRRLKTGIARVATLASWLGLYRFKYLGGAVEHVGVMAQEMLDVMPGAVAMGADDFMRVDYQMLGLEMLTCRSWQDHPLSSLRCLKRGLSPNWTAPTIMQSKNSSPQEHWHE